MENEHSGAQILKHSIATFELSSFSQLSDNTIRSTFS